MRTVHLLGGLGNQLWIAAYCHHLLHAGHRVCLDTSWYQPLSCFFFRKRRYRRLPYTQLLSNILPTIAIQNSPASLVCLKVKILLLSIFSTSPLSRSLYYQCEEYLSEAFLVALANSITQFAPFSTQKKNQLRMTTALHLRLGDRGGTLNQFEQSSLISLLKSLDTGESIFLFSDDLESALHILTHYLPMSHIRLLDCCDDLLSLHALALCRQRLFIRRSTYLDWAEAISPYV